MVFPQVLASSLLASPDVPVVSSAADGPSVAVALSAIPLSSCCGYSVRSHVSAVVGVTTVSSILNVVNIPSATGVSTGSDITTVVGIPCYSSCLGCFCRAC